METHNEPAQQWHGTSEVRQTGEKPVLEGLADLATYRRAMQELELLHGRDVGLIVIPSR
jgi:hypothetical protein